LSEMVGKTRNKIARPSSHDPSVNPGMNKVLPGFSKGIGSLAKLEQSGIRSFGSLGFE
jgi:hypothetical protein